MHSEDANLPVDDAAATRDRIVKFLTDELGYDVKDISRGSGVPKKSRLELQKDGKSSTCVVRTTEGGRIHFRYENDGRYDVLSDVDYVIHVKTADPSALEVSMFKRDDILDAFAINRASLEASGQAHLPQWLNPEKEAGKRFEGSGYAGKAIWRQSISKAVAQSNSAALETENGQVQERPAEPESFMEKITREIAEHLGVPRERIEVSVTFRS